MVGGGETRPGAAGGSSGKHLVTSDTVMLDAALGASERSPDVGKPCPLSLQSCLLSLPTVFLPNAQVGM